MTSELSLSGRTPKTLIDESHEPHLGTYRGTACPTEVRVESRSRALTSFRSSPAICGRGSIPRTSLPARLINAACQLAGTAQIEKRLVDVKDNQRKCRDAVISNFVFIRPQGTALGIPISLVGATAVSLQSDRAQFGAIDAKLGGCDGRNQKSHELGHTAPLGERHS